MAEYSSCQTVLSNQKIGGGWGGGGECSVLLRFGRNRFFYMVGIAEMVLACGLAPEETRLMQPLVETCACVCAVAYQLFGELLPNLAKKSLGGKEWGEKKKKKEGLYRFHENRLLKRGEGAYKCLD